MLDKKYNAQEKESKWLNYWNENKIYKFIPDGRKVFSIDTPPPTVNGKIHIGHIFSYSQTEMIARYKRLRGFNIFYPFGFDDNGLPSERLVEKEQGKKAHEIGREEFSKLCYQTTDKYEAEFQELFSRMGVSTDWDIHYKTVSPSTIKISQTSFLDLIDKGHCYHKESPALWCNECLTSIAQAELETKTIKTTFNYINFKTVEDGEEFTIATTRPELLPAIVCVFVNPNDEKHKSLIGKTAHIPVIDVEVPIMADEKVAIDKGTGVVMCCTFGDQTDIEWWKKYDLPLKYIFTNDGRIIDSIPNYGGLKIKEARKQIIEDLQHLAETRSGTFPQITFNSELANIEILLPPLETQEKIAQVLSSLDDKIELNNKINQNLEQQAQAIFKSWFVDFEPFGGKIPDDWRIGNLNDLSKEIICGKTPSTKNKEFYGKDVPFITIPDMHGNVFVINTERYLSTIGANTQNNKFLPPNSICVSCIATAGLVSITSVVSQTNQQINSIIPSNNNWVYYIYLYLKNLSKHIQMLGSSGSTTCNLNKGQFSKINILCPNKNVINDFYNIVFPIFSQILINQQENINLTQLRDTLLPKLMSGEIDVDKVGV